MEEDKKREDFESIEPKLNKAFEENSKISEEFRDLARACFGRIFYMLGEKNFRRWINTQQINTQIRKIVIESMTNEEMENKPVTIGSYNYKTNKIKLSPKYSAESTKDTNVHETFHMLTNNKNKFCTFLNEGLTEYLKGMAINKPNSYTHNVNSVKFLHEVFGDSLIKEYLMGKKDFDYQLFQLIGYDKLSTMSYIEKFYSNLDAVHSYEKKDMEKSAFIARGATPVVIEKAIEDFEEAKKEFEIAKPEILEMYQKIIVGRISEMSKNLEFYKNGNLDLEKSSKVINDLIEKSSFIDFTGRDSFIENAEWMNATWKLATEQVLENSHILESYKDESREKRKNELIEKMTPQIVGTETQITTSPALIKNTDITPEENSNIPAKLFENLLKDNMSITDYIGITAKIAKVTGISDEELENYLNKYNIKYFGDVGNFKKINETIHTIAPKIQKLNELQEQRKKDTVKSEYKSIGDNRFVEKRDNQIFLVQLDENGNFSEQEIKNSRAIIFVEDKTKIEIDSMRGLPNLKVKINNKDIEIGKTLDIQELKDKEIANAFSRDIKKAIEKGKYITILDDAENPWKIEGIRYTADIDKRTRKIDFDRYVADLNEKMKIIPQSQKNNFIKENTEQLLDKTFRIPKSRYVDGTIRRAENVEKSYSNIIDAINKSVKNGKIDMANRTVIDADFEVLTNVRKDMTERNSKTALILFENEKAEKRYKIIKKREKNDLEQQILEEAPKKFEYDSFYELEGDIPLDEIPFHLKGVRTTAVVDSRNVKFSYNEFSEATKEFIDKYPQEIHEILFDDIFKNQMKKTFFLSGSKKEMSPELLEAVKNVKTSIQDKIFNNTDIDDEQMKDNLSLLNNYRVQKVKEAKKSMGVQFESKDSENMFSTFSDLLKYVQSGGVTTDEVTGTIRDIMSAQMEKEDRKNNINRDE